ncbi:MAG: cytochrome c [Acidobacteria bacterium]|nr:cytochrome c [Acidobacteriota bacterium]
MKKKTIAGMGLAVTGLAVIFALISFWRANWGANQTPGAVERFLAGWLLSSSRYATAEIPNPLTPTEANLAEGQGLYEKQCAFCHGLDGSGSGSLRVQFYPPVPSLVPSPNQLTDSQMHFVVQRGVRYTAMPSFAKALTEDQIWKVVLWVRKLSEPQPTGASAAPSGTTP